MTNPALLLLLLLLQARPWSRCCLASLWMMVVTLLLSGCQQWPTQCGHQQQVSEPAALCCCVLG
jgi:hypothetical protein